MAITIKVNVEGQSINDVKNSIDSLDKSVNNLEESSISLKTQLKNLTQELQGLEPGSERFNELAIKAGQLKDTINDTNAVIKATAGSGIENLASGLASIGQVGIGAFQGIASAQALFGVESEQLQQTLVKLQALAGLSDALKSLGGFKDTLTNIKASFSAVAGSIGLFTKAQNLSTVATAASSVALGAQTTATGAATVASNALNVSLLANPVFLLVAAIGAVVGALVYFSEETENAEQANDKLNETLELQQNILDRQVEKANRAADNRVRLLQAQGASEKEVFDAQQEALRQEEVGRIKSLQQLEFTLQDKNVLLRRAQSEGDEDLAKSIKKEIDSTRDKYKNLRNLDGQYSKDKQILTAQFETDQAAEEKRQAEETRARNKAAYEKRLADQEKFNQERLAATRRLKDLELSVLEEGQDKEEQIQIEATKRELEDLNKKYGDRKKLSATLLAEVNALEAAIKEQGNDKLLDIDKKYSDKKLAEDAKLAQDVNKAKTDAENEYQTSLEKIREDNFQASLSVQDREIQAVNDKYFTLLTLAEGNAEDLAAIEEAKERELTDINKKYTEERQKQIKSSIDTLAGILNEFGSTTGNAFASAIGNTLAQASLAFDTFTDDNATKLEKFGAAVQAITSIVNGFISAAVASNKEKLDQDIANIDEANTREQESLQAKYDAGLISKEQFEKSSADLDAKAVAEKNKKGKEAFDKNKKLQIASAAVAGLQGAVSAFAGAMSLGPIAGPIVGAVLAAAVAGLTAVNIGKIKSTQFESASTPSGGGSPNVSSSSLGGNQAAQPAFNLFGQGNNANTVGAGSQQQQNQNMNMTVQSSVSVTEINAVQNKVAVQESRSTL